METQIVPAFLTQAIACVDELLNVGITCLSTLFANDVVLVFFN